MKYINKKRLVNFLKKYTNTKAQAINLMSTGDINSYLKELIEMDRSKKKALSLLVKNS